MMLTLDAYSRTHKAQRQPDQVQGPMPPVPVHAGVEGCGKGGQVEAEFTSGYVKIACGDPERSIYWEHVYEGRGGLTNFEITGLKMMDVPKRNKKGKRVA